MDSKGLLGIDAGGTHTDAVLLTHQDGAWQLTAAAKVETCHEDLPGTVRRVLTHLMQKAEAVGCSAVQRQVERVSLGTTLAVNALVQGRGDRVGLALSAGPGLDPRRFTLGEDVCIVPGGLDHRGVEVSPLDCTILTREVTRWRASGVTAVACVGKFSPRNPSHEQAMARAAGSALPVTMGHALSGQLNFPRRIATAYFNAAVARLQGDFLNAVESALREAGITATPRLLKADGGAIPFSLARQEPVQSILSGPAASVMGVMALCPQAAESCSLLLDMGGTTSDLALFADGSPVLEREGMLLQGRRTLVRALACVSIGVGGDSLLHVSGHGLSALVSVGPERLGPAMAFGGQYPTLLDALNLLDCPNGDMTGTRGNITASLQGVTALAHDAALPPDELARQAVNDALNQIGQAVQKLVTRINARPIYTLAALRAVHEIRPERIWLVGGPANCIRKRLAAALQIPVFCPPHSAVANAVGAALALPSHSLEIYADTGRTLLRAPALDLEESIDRSCTLENVKARAVALLTEHLTQAGADDAAVEVVEADMFATLDERGRGSKDIRVVCQARPGIAGRLAQTAPEAG